MFYMYRQNNSGGTFVGPRAVLVEATYPAEADRRAEKHSDVYFESKAGDCPNCCGPRWRKAMEWDGEMTLEDAMRRAVERGDKTVTLALKE